MSQIKNALTFVGLAAALTLPVVASAQNAPTRAEHRQQQITEHREETAAVARRRQVAREHATTEREQAAHAVAEHRAAERHAAVEHAAAVRDPSNPRHAGQVVTDTVEHPRQAIVTHEAPGTPVAHPATNSAEHLDREMARRQAERRAAEHHDEH